MDAVLIWILEANRILKRPRRYHKQELYYPLWLADFPNKHPLKCLYSKVYCNEVFGSPNTLAIHLLKLSHPMLLDAQCLEGGCIKVKLSVSWMASWRAGSLYRHKEPCSSCLATRVSPCRSIPSEIRVYKEQWPPECQCIRGLRDLQLNHHWSIHVLNIYFKLK